MGDIGVIERGQHFGLALKASQAARIAGEGVGENLQGHIALQLGVTSAVHLAHAARRKERHNLVGTQEPTRFEQDWFDDQLCRSCRPRARARGFVMVRQQRDNLSMQIFVRGARLAQPGIAFRHGPPQGFLEQRLNLLPPIQPTSWISHSESPSPPNSRRACAGHRA